ncbi:hypothetical protein ACOSP7_031215 [Xanthoceras sorbifolium]
MEERQQRNDKGKAKVGENYNSWTVEQTNLFLQLMVEVVARGYSGFIDDLITKRFTTNEEVWKNYFKSHPKDRYFRTKTLVDYDDLRVVIGNATASGRYSIGMGHDTDARVIGLEDRYVGIQNYVFDENNNAFVQSEHEPSHQASPLEQSMSPLSFQNMGSKIASKSTNYKMRNISDYERKSNIWDVIKEIPKLDSFTRYKALALLNTKIKMDAFLKMSLEERIAWILYTLE